MRLVKRGCLSIIAVVVCLIVLGVSVNKYATDRHSLPDNVAAWGQSGNFIVGYGPVQEPYVDAIKNTYQVFSPDGQWLDETTQRGGYYPVAIPTRQGSYLYFADAIKQVGEHTHEVDIKDYDPIEYVGNSETGTFGIAAVNASGANKFSYDIITLRSDGKSTKFSTDIVPISLAVGKDYALVAGYLSSQKRLLLVDDQGKVTETSFPDEYRLDSPDFPYSYVNYLGNDRFEILQADRVVEGKRGHTADLTSFEIELKKNHADTKRVLSVSHFTKELPEDFLINYVLSYGDTGYTTRDGRVYVHKRLANKPTFTGQLAGFSEKRPVTDDDFINVNSQFGEPLFGIQEKDFVSIRSWFEPNKVKVTIPLSKNACFFDIDEVCDLASISKVP